MLKIKLNADIMNEVESNVAGMEFAIQVMPYELASIGNNWLATNYPQVHIVAAENKISLHSDSGTIITAAESEHISTFLSDAMKKLLEEIISGASTLRH